MIHQLLFSRFGAIPKWFKPGNLCTSSILRRTHTLVEQRPAATNWNFQSHAFKSCSSHFLSLAEFLAPVFWKLEQENASDFTGNNYNSMWNPPHTGPGMALDAMRTCDDPLPIDNMPGLGQSSPLHNLHKWNCTPVAAPIFPHLDKRLVVRHMPIPCWAHWTWRFKQSLNTRTIWNPPCLVAQYTRYTKPLVS